MHQFVFEQQRYVRCFVSAKSCRNRAFVNDFIALPTHIVDKNQSIKTYAWKHAHARSTHTNPNYCYGFFFVHSISIPTHQVYFSARFIHRGVFLIHLFSCVCLFETFSFTFFSLSFSFRSECYIHPKRKRELRFNAKIGVRALHVGLWLWRIRTYNCFPCFSEYHSNLVRSGVLMGQNVSSAIIRFASIYGNATIHIFHTAKLCVCVCFFIVLFEVNLLFGKAFFECSFNLIQKENVYEERTGTLYDFMLNKIIGINACCWVLAYWNLWYICGFLWHYLYVCTENMVQCMVKTGLCSLFSSFFCCVSSHHFNPILREYETMVWFFISQKLSCTAFLRSYFTNWFYCALDRELGHIFVLDTYSMQRTNFKSLSVYCMKRSWTKILRKSDWIFVCLYDSKLRIAHRKTE